MSDKDPETNGGLPPKISLKPKQDEPAKQDSAQTPAPVAPSPPPAAAPRKPITLRKPVPLATATQPAQPSDQMETAPVRENAAPKENSTPDSDQAEAPVTPKRPVLRPVSASPSGIKRPAPLGIRKEAPDPMAAPGTKKSTSRITLPTAASEKSTSGQIRTIKIAPRSQTSAIEGAADDAAGKPAVVADPKRQTSRISLESVLGSQPANAPATIKIKRAQTASGTTGESRLDPQAGDVTLVDARDSDEKAEPVADNKPESQKKTLKVKRPAVSSSDRPSVSTGQTMFTPPAATGKGNLHEPHWFFALVAIAATLVAGVLIYVLAAQVADPDLIEQPAPGTGLPWPARLAE